MPVAVRHCRFRYLRGVYAHLFCDVYVTGLDHFLDCHHQYESAAYEICSNIRNGNDGKRKYSGRRSGSHGADEAREGRGCLHRAKFSFLLVRTFAGNEYYVLLSGLAFGKDGDCGRLLYRSEIRSEAGDDHHDCQGRSDIAQDGRICQAERITGSFFRISIGGGRAGHNRNRDVAVDIEKGILMVAMLAGHMTINPGLRKMIYSFYMAAFVVLSGYFYKKGRGLKNTLRGLFRTFLIPYGIFCAVHFAISWTGNPEHGVLYYMKQYLFGMSFSKNLWQDVPSVGPIYFLLLLLLVRLFYYGTDQALCYAAKKRKAETGKWEAVLYRMLAAIGLSVAGMYLGKAGWWLPWSADAALYCVLFYWAGIQLKEYHIPERCSNNPYLYFFLAPVWAYAIYEGNMSIAGRDYTPYGIIIAGALSAVLLLYMFSRYLRDHWSPYIVWFLALTGESSVCILLIHTLFNRRIGDFYTRWFHPEYIYHMAASNGTQILLGIMIWMLIKIYKRKDRKVFRKTA